MTMHVLPLCSPSFLWGAAQAAAHQRPNLCTAHKLSLKGHHTLCQRLFVQVQAEDIIFWGLRVRMCVATGICEGKRVSAVALLKYCLLPGAGC